MIYFDSSALLKLVFEEHESAALAAWFADQQGRPTCSSQLAKVEVLRAARRIEPAAVPAARQLVVQLDLIPITTVLIEDAAEVGSAPLRTLNAIHLASAISLGSALTAFVVYDPRLAAAAKDAKLPIVRPGLS